MKHINIWFHFIHETIKDGTFNLIYCPMDEMTADILTKTLRLMKLDFHAVGLGLGCCKRENPKNLSYSS
jgi:hypothetical protein